MRRGSREQAAAWKRAAKAWEAYAEGRGSWATATHELAQAQALELVARRQGLPLPPAAEPTQATADNSLLSAELCAALLEGELPALPRAFVLERVMLGAVTPSRAEFLSAWLADDDPSGIKSAVESAGLARPFMYGTATGGNKSTLENRRPAGVTCAVCGASGPLTPGCGNCEAWAAAVVRAVRRSESLLAERRQRAPVRVGALLDAKAAHVGAPSQCTGSGAWCTEHASRFAEEGDIVCDAALDAMCSPAVVPGRTQEVFPARAWLCNGCGSSFSTARDKCGICGCGDVVPLPRLLGSVVEAKPLQCVRCGKAYTAAGRCSDDACQGGRGEHPAGAPSSAAREGPRPLGRGGASAPLGKIANSVSRANDGGARLDARPAVRCEECRGEGGAFHGPEGFRRWHGCGVCGGRGTVRPAGAS